jgi:hypothetical protein
MGGAYSSYGEEWGIHKVFVGRPGVKDHLGDTGLEGRRMLKWIVRNCDVGFMDSIELCHDRDRLWAHGNTVMNVRFP